VKSPAKPSPSFEDALEKLETLVANMESGEISLAEMIEQFEEGNRLLSVCAQRLQHAEQRIEVLKQSRGDVSVEILDREES